MHFADLVTPRKLEPGLYAHDVPDGWQQGPGAFGGLVIGMLARVAIDFEGDAARPLRALQAQVLAPVLPGAAEVRAQLLRRGGALTSVNVQLMQQGQLAATADVVLAKARVSEGGNWAELSPPAFTRWQDVAPVEMPRQSIWPPFAQHFEYRALPPMALSASPRAEANGWVRAREPGPGCDAALVVALIDAWWPAPFARLTAPRPMTTFGFGFQLFVDPSTLDPAVPLAYRAKNPLGHEGYTLELRELWTGDGRAVAQNQQTFLIVK
jgi:hypothetical protein